MAISETLHIESKRLASIAYHVVGVHTEGGPTPYTGAANAGGASGLSIGTMQHDFGQRPATASGYAQAIVGWYLSNNQSTSFTAAQLESAILKKSLTQDQRTATAEFGASVEGAKWIFDNLEKTHVDAAVQAAQQAFATQYGQAVLQEGAHIEEFAAFSMKVFNQYGGGPLKINGEISDYKFPGFQGLLEYLNKGQVKLRDNRSDQNGETVLVAAQNPGQFDRDDLVVFSRGYASTRSNQLETNSPTLGDGRAIISGPLSALNSGALYSAILESDSPLSDVLKRVESKGDFSPTLVTSDPDVALARAMFGADTGRMKSAVAAINDATTVDAISVSATLGQYPGTLWIDPLSGRIALSYKGSSSGFVVGSDGYTKFATSSVVKEDGVRTLQIGTGDAPNFDQIATPLANAPLHRATAAATPIGHWEEQITYTPDLGLPLGTSMVWVPGPATTPPSNPPPVDTSPTNHTTTGAIYLSRDGASATLPDGQVINAGQGGRLELGDDGNLSAMRPTTGYGPNEIVYDVTLYNKGGQLIASTQIQVVADPEHPDDPAYNTTFVQGQARDITQLQPDGTSIVVHAVFQTGFGWVEPATGEVIQSIVKAPSAETALVDLFQKNLLDAFQNPQAPAGPGTLYADAGNGTASDAGGGSTDADFKVANLTTPALASHFAGGTNGGAYGAGQLGGFDVLPFNKDSSFLVNADGDIAGEINQLGNGYVQIKDLSGNIAYVNEQTGQAISANSYDKAQAAEVGSALGLMQSIIGLQNWDSMSDLQRVAAIASIYNVVDKLSGGQLPGELGGAVAVLGLLNALDKGDVGGIAINGIAVVDFFGDGMASQAIGTALGIDAANVLPGLGFVLALDSGDPVSIASSGLSLYGALSGASWAGPVGIGVAIFASLLSSKPDIPMREGIAHAEWDAAGNTIVITDQDSHGGGATAAGWMNSLVNSLQAQLSNTHDAAGNSYALIPNLLPAIGFQYDPDGFNLANGATGFMVLRWLDDSGTQQTRYYDGAGSRGDGTGETLAGDFMAHAQGAIAPSWQVATTLTHFQQGQGIHLPASTAGLPQGTGDGTHQSLQALTLALPIEPALTQSLVDIDGDDYLEQSQWLVNNQNALAIDANGNRRIDAGELLSLNSAGLNSLNWLDANGDKLINSADPAFAALRLWMDVNSDCNSSGETQTLNQAGIIAIDFGSNPPSIVRADGSRTTLTVQTLTADILGTRYQNTEGGILQLDEQRNADGTLAAPTALLHAVNTRQFDGQAAHINGGVATTTTPGTSNSAVDAGDARLSSTSAKTIGNQSSQTSTTLSAGDARLQSAPNNGAASQPQTTTTATAQSRSNTIAFVPASGASAAQEQRQATEAMIRSTASSLFDVAGALPLAAMAVGAAAVQWPVVTSAGTSNVPGSDAPPNVQTNAQTWVGTPVRTDSQLHLSPDATLTDQVRHDNYQSTPLIAVVTPAETPQSWIETQIRNDSAFASSAGTDSEATGAPSVIPNLIQDPGTSVPSNQSTTFTTAEGVALDYPRIQGEKAGGVEDTALRFAESLLLVNDSTVNSPAFPNQPNLRITSVFAPLHGSVSLQLDASGQTRVVFVPEANYHGPASFSYTVTDQYGLSSNATTTISIAAINDAPVTVGETAAGNEDTTLKFTAASLLANDSDVDNLVDGDVLRITRVGMAQHGQVFLGPDGTVSFVPDPNYNGPAQFTYWVGDRTLDKLASASNGGEGYETPAAMQLTILPVNDLPVVTGESIASDEDIVLSINPALLLTNDTDVDAAPGNTGNTEPDQVLSITAVGNARHGSIALMPDGTLQFTPQRDYFGVACFEYTVDDGHGGQVVGTTVINLAPVNDAPVVMGETVSFNEDEIQTIAPANLLANDSDVDNPHTHLRIISVDNATHGSVALNPDGSIRFAPTADYFGPASFTYTVGDGAGGFTVGTATLDIAPVNDAPRLTGESLALDEDTQVHFAITALLANDIDLDNPHSELSITAANMDPASSAAGTVQIVDGEIVFTPTLNFNGQASFSYTVTDGVGGDSQTSVNLTFIPINDAPVANSELVFGKRNVSYTLSKAALLANDTDVETPNNLHIDSIGNVQHGAAILKPNGGVQFTPDAGFAGRGSFDYVVMDPDGATSTATAQIDFSRINTSPITTNDSFIGFEDVPFSITAAQLLINDSDVDNALADLRVTAVAGATNGTVNLQPDGSIRFVANANFYGNASFTYQVSDGDGGQTWAVAQLSVQSVNDAPVIEDIFYGRPIYGYTVFPIGTDEFGVPLYGNIEVVLESQARALFYSGELFGSSGSFYQNGQLRPIRFDYIDATESYSEYSNLIDDPSRQRGSVVAYDPDGDSSQLSFSISSSPQHGHAWANMYTSTAAPAWQDHTQTGSYWVGETGAWQYYSQLGDGYSGSDYFTVRVTDSGGAYVDQSIGTTHMGSSAGGGGGKKPVTLDLNGNGLHYLDIDDSKAYFDINNDGWREHLAWLAPDDGLLVRDIGGDRLIERYDEISFTGYLPGAKTDLEGLTAFDSNHDGLLSRLDTRWKEFAVWQDTNGDGVSDAGEVRTLDDIGIAQIGLTSDQQTRVVNGVTEHGQAQFVWTDARGGNTGAVGDVSLPFDITARVPAAETLDDASNETMSALIQIPPPTPLQMAQLMAQMINAMTADLDSAPLAFIALGDDLEVQHALAQAQDPWGQRDIATSPQGLG